MRLAGPPLLAWLAAKARGGVIGRAHSFGGSVESTDPQSPREQCGAVGKRKALHTPPLPAPQSPSQLPSTFCGEKHIHGATPLPAIPPLSLNLSACRALPRHCLEPRDRRSRSVLHRGCETKRASGTRHLPQHQARPAGDHKAKRSTRLERCFA